MAAQPTQTYTHGTSTIEIYPTKVIFKQYGNIYITIPFDSIIGNNSFYGIDNTNIVLKVAWNNNAGNSGVFIIVDLRSNLAMGMDNPYYINFFNLNGYTNINGNITNNRSYEGGFGINQEIYDALMSIFLQEVQNRGGQPLSGINNFANTSNVQDMLDFYMLDFYNPDLNNPDLNNGQLVNRNIPANASNIISTNNIENGTNMVNFHGEFGHGRYYTKNTFNQIQPHLYSGKKRNPFTQQNIKPGNITRYRAKKTAPTTGGRRKRKTMKRRVNKKKKTQRRR